jgi:large subunit ribosomal protein L19
MESLIKFVQDEFVTKKEIPTFKSGDTITVYYEIREGDKVRTQFFKGIVIQIKGTGLTKTFTIRKMSGTIGIERIFPINLPAIQKIEVNKRGRVKKARIKEIKR